MSREDFSQVRQDRYFADADAAHFRWTTEDRAFAPVEDALLAPWIDGLGPRCLEIGCGEGTNLARLGRLGRPFGLDRYPEKARFAARAVPAARLLVGDAAALPVRSGSLSGVLIRDLFHHLKEPRRAASEAVRVLAPGATLVVFEPNGLSPFIRLQTRLVAAEAGARGFTPETIAELLDGLPIRVQATAMAQGFPLRRLLLHYRFGWPALGRARGGAAVLAALERAGERLLARRRWSYTIVRARRA